MRLFLLRWVDDNSLVNDSFTNWDEGEPFPGESFNCMLMSTDSNGNWTTFPCDAAYPAMCSMRYEVVPPFSAIDILIDGLQELVI